MQDTLFSANSDPDVPKLIPSQMLTACGALVPALRSHSQEDAHEFLVLVRDVLDRILLHRKRMLCTFSDKPVAATTTAGKAAAVMRARTRAAHAAAAAALPQQSLAAHVFGGTWQSDVTCACGNVSTTVEPFMDVSIQIGHAHLEQLAVPHNEAKQELGCAEHLAEADAAEGSHTRMSSQSAMHVDYEWQGCSSASCCVACPPGALHSL